MVMRGKDSIAQTIWHLIEKEIFTSLIPNPTEKINSMEEYLR